MQQCDYWTFKVISQRKRGYFSVERLNFFGRNFVI